MKIIASIILIAIILAGCASTNKSVSIGIGRTIHSDGTTSKSRGLGVSVGR
jgi:PBP1b-binding outer membrane lipoprotein LpoB